MTPASAANPTPTRSSRSHEVCSTPDTSTTPSGGSGDGEEVPRAAAERGGEPERPEELDGHGDADGQVRQRGVERGVHRGEREPEEHDGAPVGRGCARATRAARRHTG